MIWTEAKDTILRTSPGADDAALAERLGVSPRAVADPSRYTGHGKVCWKIGCHAPATRIRRRRFLCEEHGALAAEKRGPRPPTHIRPVVTAADVSIARRLLADGASLSFAAQRCGVLKTDLDIALWRAI